MNKYKVAIQLQDYTEEKEVNADKVEISNNFAYFYKENQVVFAVSSSNIYYFEKVK